MDVDTVDDHAQLAEIIGDFVHDRFDELVTVLDDFLGGHLADHRPQAAFEGLAGDPLKLL